MHCSNRAYDAVYARPRAITKRVGDPMALVSVDTGRSVALPERGQGLVFISEEERRKAMRQARRHTWLVRLLKVVLPSIVVVLIASYGLFMQRTISISTGDGELKFKTENVTLESLSRPTMRNASYEGFNQKDGSSYVIKARQAVTDLIGNKPIDLFGISGNLLQKDGVRTVIKAVEGNFDRKSGRLVLTKGIDVESTNGMAAKLSDAEILTKEGTIRTNNPVAVRFPAGTLNGNKMLVRQKQREVIFSNGVIARLVPQKKKEDAGAPEKPNKTTQGLMSFAGQSSDPVDVQSNILFVKDNQNSARFSGQVRASQGDASLTARVLDIAYGQPGKENSAPGASANLKRLIARENVIMTRGQDRIVSAVADFDVAANRGVLDGGVVVTSGPDRKVMAQRADIDSSRDTILLTGSKVVVVQGENSLQGTRLYFDQRNGVMRLTSPGSRTAAAGKVRARFVNQRQGKARQVAQVAKQSAAGLGQSFRTDPNAPVELVASSLDVNDRKREAVFGGGVEAIQGGFKIKTEILRATYTGSAGGALQGSNGAQANQANAQLQSIFAPKRIVVTSEGGQSAAGDTGTFDYKKNEVLLSGNVVLRQGRQVVQGDKLRIDLTSGLSRIERKSGPAWSSVARDSQGSARPSGLDSKVRINGGDQRACGGRMCATFYPGDLQKLRNRAQGGAAKPRPSNQAPAEIGSGWSASTGSN